MASAACALVCAVAAAAAQERREPEGPWPLEAPVQVPLQELPLPTEPEGPMPPDAPPGGFVSRAPAEATSAIGNDDILAMTEAEFSDATIVAAIEANATRFDVSPRTLVALKGAGVSERVLEAMLGVEATKRQSAGVADAGVAAEAAGQPVAPAPGSAGTPAAQVSPEALLLLTQMIERLAVAQEAAVQEPAAELSKADELDLDAPAENDRSPRVWVASGKERAALPPTIAQVAFTDERGLGSNALRTLQGFAGKALLFANPALGIASTLGGFLRSDEGERTAVWALAGGTARRTLPADPAFEIEFGNIPGVNPDEYQPTIVRLVPTGDNYRLVAAAKTSGASAGAPSGPIVEEPIPTKLDRIGRGHYRVAPGLKLGAGEYALVLRPIEKKERRRRRDSEGSLGALLGGGTSQILYLTWDFTVAS